jgi:hypothetical protein
VERVLVRVMPPSSPPRSSRDFDVLRPPLLERAARIVARLQICAVDDRRRVVPMGASRARHVNGSRRRQGSTCFRSNDGSCSVRAVFGLPPRSDRGSRRADAVPIPTALSSRQDLTVIALFRFKLFRFKEYRRMRRQQGGGRPAGLAGVANREGEETKRRSLAGHHPGSAAHRRRPAVRARCGPDLLHGLPAEPSSSGRSHRVPEATRSLASARLLRQHHDERVLHVRRDARRRHELSGAGRYGSVLGAGTAAQAWKSDPASHPERLSSPRRGRPMNLVVRRD